MQTKGRVGADWFAVETESQEAAIAAHREQIDATVASYTGDG